MLLQPGQALPPILKTKGARWLLLVPFGIIASLVLLEIPALFDVLDYRTTIGVAPHDVFTATNVQDRELGHIHPPYSHFRGQTRGGGLTVGYRIPKSDMTLYQWDVKYDQNGFRNEVDLKKADMIVLGDSFVEEITISDSELMTTRLARLEGKVIANLGQYGYGPQQELAVLQRYGLVLEPRTVLWMFYEGNDLEDAMNYERIMHTSPPGFWRAFVTRSFTRNAFKKMKSFVFSIFRSPGINYSGAIQTSSGGQVTMYFLPFPRAPLNKDELDAIAKTGEVLTTAHKLCAAHGARLILVFVPDKFRVFRDYCRFPSASECRNWTPSDLPERLRTAVERISPDIGFLDLTASLIDAVKRGEIPYYPDDDHWSPEGHKIAAEAIHSYMLSR